MGLGSRTGTKQPNPEQASTSADQDKEGRDIPLQEKSLLCSQFYRQNKETVVQNGKLNIHKI